MKKQIVVAMAMFAAVMLAFGVTQAADAQSTDNPAEVEAGATIFAGSCAGCHGADGEGSSRGRPLVGIAMENERAVHVASVTDGKGGMPAFADRLSAEQIDAALSYVRLTFVEAAAATTQTDDAASSDSPELAITGAETPLVAVGGLTLLAAGALMVHHSRRNED